MRFAWVARVLMVVVAGLVVAGTPTAARAESQFVIVSGSGGTPEFEKRFEDWTGRLRRGLIQKMGVNERAIQTLVSIKDVPTTATAATLESIKLAVEGAAAKINPESDDLYLFLIGHGGHIRRETKFNIPGPDLSATELAGWLGSVKVRRMILINAAPSSAGFINALSAPDRIICSATKSVEEKNATRFMEAFLKAMEEGSADSNRDERVSVLEICRQAAALTDAAYKADGLIATEHSLIDDNGDGLGTRLAELGISAGGGEAPDVVEVKIDGEIAAATFLKDFQFPPSVPEELVSRYLSALAKAEKLRGRKKEMGEEAYYRELESVMVAAARANREIRQIMGRETGAAAR